MAIRKGGTELKSVEQWFELAPPKHPSQWKKDRSAMETAIAWIDGGGRHLPTEVAVALAGHPDFGRVIQWEAEPEARLSFDQFRGEPRNTDMAVHAVDHHGPFFLAIEAKADEPFGETFGDTLRAAVDRYLKNPRSNGVMRCLQLVEAIFGRSAAGEAFGLESLRYQLLTACSGALCEAERHGFRRTVMMVQEFITKDTTIEKRRVNANDLDVFVAKLSGNSVTRVEPGKIYGPFSVPGAPPLKSPPALYISKVQRALTLQA